MSAKAAVYTLCLSLSGALFSPGTSAGQDVALEPHAWVFSQETGSITTYKGAPALSLHNATAWLKDGKFANGTIEFKVAFPSQRGFVGIKFRARDEENYAHFYLRPHQSGKPDANQYTPVFHGNSGWQIYYGPRYSTAVEYPYEDWIDVKLVVSGNAADVYIDSDEPILHVADLMLDTNEGMVGFNSFLTEAFISDVRITDESAPSLKGREASLPDIPDHLITDWQVAGPVATLSGKVPDASEISGDIRWRRLPVEENGIANLGRLGSRSDGHDTMLARLKVHADRPLIKPLHIGFSDKVAAFVNGRPAYGGDDSYRSRDYRFLGTVGRFDTIFLSLSQGSNEILFAVREGFGGWALTAAFEDMAGIRLEREAE